MPSFWDWGRLRQGTVALPSGQDYYQPTTNQGYLSQLRTTYNQGGPTEQGEILEYGLDPRRALPYVSDYVGRDVASGASAAELRDVLSRFHETEASRLQDLLPEYENYLLGAVNTPVDMDELFSTQQRFGQSVIDDVWGPFGQAEQFQFSSLSNEIGSGRGVRSGGHIRDQNQFRNDFSRYFTNALAQNQASLYSTAQQGRSANLGALFNLLDSTRRMYGDQADSVFTGLMGIENQTLNKLGFLRDTAATDANIRAQKKAQRGGGIGGVLGGIAGSLLGPIGSAVGSQLGNWIFPDED